MIQWRQRRYNALLLPSPAGAAAIAVDVRAVIIIIVMIGSTATATTNDDVVHARCGILLPAQKPLVLILLIIGAQTHEHFFRVGKTYPPQTLIVGTAAAHGSMFPQR